MGSGEDRVECITVLLNVYCERHTICSIYIKIRIVKILFMKNGVKISFWYKKLK